MKDSQCDFLGKFDGHAYQQVPFVLIQEERSPNTQESFVEIDLGNGENTQDNHSSRWASEKRDFERLFFHGNKIKIRDICVWYFIVLFVMVYMALFFSGYNWFDLSRVTAKIHNLTAVTMEMNETLHQLNGTLKDLIPELREEIVTLLGANNTIEH